MSKKTVKEMITDALEDLSARDIKKFKEKLCDREEEPRVTRRSVEDVDEMDLAVLLVKICTEAKAVQVTTDIFTQLGFSDQAAKLRNAVAAAAGSGQANSESGTKYMTGDIAAAAGSSQANSESRTKYMIGGQHFIDKHHIWLIDNISSVEPILDRLKSKNVITQENYSHIRRKSTSNDSMRELFELGRIRSTTKGKDCLYDVLMEIEPFVMEELKERL